MLICVVSRIFIYPDHEILAPICLVETAMLKTTETKKKRKKNTALIICTNQKQFWTTQRQFWQWIREGVIRKIGDQPLTGCFCREDEELMVVLSNTVLSLAHPNHLREALLSRRIGLAKKN
ncbi:MAG TPA: hypothetical protein VMS31_14950 [Pyrinomonadaceae bacterium]|nr:hypothetical protein [Pyrinomonadaceae bacterium]